MSLHIGPIKPRKKPKYSLEIDVTDVECERFFPRWANYGTIVCEGDTLDELLRGASVDIMDQDGGELWVGPADEKWMADLIAEEVYEAMSDAAADREWDRSNGVYPDGSEPVEPRKY